MNVRYRLGDPTDHRAGVKCLVKMSGAIEIGLTSDSNIYPTRCNFTQFIYGVFQKELYNFESI
jgi:hypothetical protein